MVGAQRCDEPPVTLQEERFGLVESTEGYENAAQIRPRRRGKRVVGGQRLVEGLDRLAKIGLGLGKFAPLKENDGELIGCCKTNAP